MISYEDFDKVDICIGKIVEVEDLPEARKKEVLKNPKVAAAIVFLHTPADIPQVYNSKEPYNY